MFHLRHFKKYFSRSFLFSLSMLLAVNNLGNSMDGDNVSLCSVGYPGGNRPVQSPSAITPYRGRSESNFAPDGPGLLASYAAGDSRLILQCQGPTPRASVCNEGTSSSQALAQIDPRLSRQDHRNSVVSIQGRPPPPQLQQRATLASSFSGHCKYASCCCIIYRWPKVHNYRACIITERRRSLLKVHRPLWSVCLSV